MSKDMEKALHGCFYPKSGKPNLKRVPVNSGRERGHLDKANTNLRAMQIMFDNNLFDWAIIFGKEGEVRAEGRGEILKSPFIQIPQYSCRTPSPEG